MSESDNTQSGESGGFGCWAMVIIAIIVIFAVIVGYLVLV